MTPIPSFTPLGGGPTVLMLHGIVGGNLAFAPQVETLASSGYRAVAWDREALIVLGSEGAGLRPRVRDACDLLVTIPTAGHVASLNIAVATGLLVFEAVRNAN